MQPDASSWEPAIAELQDYPTIADYLNTAIALVPPLQVRGQLPLLQIHLQAVHLGIIGSLLPRLETALRSLRGAKYWDVYIFAAAADGEAESSRLIHHLLIEQAPAIKPRTLTLPNLIAAPASLTTANERPLAAAVPARPDSFPAPSQSWSWLPSRAVADTSTAAAAPSVKPPQIGRRRRVIMGAIAVTSVSFALGTMAATAGGWWQSRQTQSAARPESATALLEPATVAPSEPVLPLTEGAIATPHAALPVSPNSLVTPVLSPDELSLAADSLAVPITPPAAIQLKAVGDVIPGTDFPNYRLPGDPNYLFNSVKMFMGEVDLVFGNFESTLTNYPYTAKDVSQGMTFAFRTPPNWTDVLKSAGFDVLSVANNHSFDFGDPGFEDTIANIQQSGMQAVGRRGDIVNVEANGYTVAFIGFSYWPDHNDMNDLATATALVQQAQSEADVVVISVHAGAEGTDAMRVRDQTEYFFSENRGNMVQFSRTMVEAGADLILGHGPHVPRAVELYQGKLIAYSLGNFLGYRTLSTSGPLGLSMILQVDLSETGDFLKGRVIPVALDQNGVPYVDHGFASVTLVRQLTQRDFPETPLTIDEMGYILKTELP